MNIYYKYDINKGIDKNKGDRMTGLVLEGGAMRGLYTAGVLDVLMEQRIPVDGIIGVSAGAVFGVNYLSSQPGRVLRYNSKYNKERNYMGLIPLLKTGNIIDTHYAYEKVPQKLDPFDDPKFMASNIPFYCVVTNIHTGNPEYIQIKSVFKQMDYLRASASMPFVSKPVKIMGNEYLDGAITDSIPFERFRKMGYQKNIVVLTKPNDYIKKPIPKFLAKKMYESKYPKLEEKIENRHIMYNKQIVDLRKLEKQGDTLVICPSKHIKISKMEKNPEKMRQLYELGRRDAFSKLSAIIKLTK